MNQISSKTQRSRRKSARIAAFSDAPAEIHSRQRTSLIPCRAPTSTTRRQYRHPHRVSPAPAPPPPPSPHITLAAYLTEHYFERKSPAWAPGTISFRNWVIHSVLIPDLGHRPVHALTTAEVERWIYYRALTPYAHCGRLPRHSTLKSLLTTLGAALALAVSDQLLAHNPTRGIHLPRNLTEPPTLWSPEQVREFLMATARSKYYPLWRLLFATGLRRGEALGLRWGDIDTEQRLITVRRSLQSHSRAGNYHFGPPKTPRSRRTISVDPDTLDILEQWRSRQRREFDRHEILPDTTTSVFTTVRADPMLPSVVSDSWRAAVARVGLPAMRLHSVRHTHLSHLLRAGEPIQNVASRAGHGTPYMTLTTYAFVIPGDDARTARRAAGLFHASEGPFTAVEPKQHPDSTIATTD